MQRRLWSMGTILLILLVIACGGKYDEVESTLNDYADAMEDYIGRMEKADSAESVANAMQDFTEKMNALIPRLQEMNQKFPELASDRDAPKELEKVSLRMTELSPKLQSAMMKAMPYMMDPQVQQAMTAQAQAMAQAGK